MAPNDSKGKENEVKKMVKVLIQNFKAQTEFEKSLYIIGLNFVMLPATALTLGLAPSYAQGGIIAMVFWGVVTALTCGGIMWLRHQRRVKDDQNCLNVHRP